MGLASLCGAQSAQEGWELLRALPWLKETPERDRRKLKVGLKNLYPGEEHWPALRSDRLADALLADLCRESDDFSACLAALPAHAGEVLLSTALNGLGRLALEAGAAGAPVVEAIERRLERHPVDPAEAHRLLAALPQSSLVLASMAVRLSQRALPGEAGMAPAERAGLLNDFSNRLADAGDRAGALQAIKEAVEVYRESAQVAHNAFCP